MAAGSTISQQKILAASQGDRTALLEVLQQVSVTSESVKAVVGLGGAPAQGTTHPNASAPVPPQAAGNVSLLKNNYIVQITNPGATPAVSQIQQTQAARGASRTSSLQPLRPIFHQIRVSTSPAFNVNSNTQTFGGNTGSTQVHWTLTGLGTGTWYFQFRSSYDGVNWNNWLNANGGSGLHPNPSIITVEAGVNIDWAVFTLPGNQLVAVGQGYVSDGGTFTLPENLYSSAMLALAGPNNFDEIGRHVCDITKCEVVASVPQDTSGTVGIPDYPVVVNMRYGDQSSPQVEWSGKANVFAIAFDPLGSNAKSYVSPDGTAIWVVFTLPGGSKLAIGQGRTPDGSNIWIPDECPWITPAQTISICSIQGNIAGYSAQGIKTCQLTAVGGNLQAQAKYGNGPNQWSGNANWLAISSNLPLETLNSGKWIVISMASGNKIVFGAGQSPDEGSLQYPGGIYEQQTLAIVTPAGYTGAGDHLLQGIAQCELVSQCTFLAYADGSGNTWGGNTNWMVFGWLNKLAQPGPTPPPTPPATIVYITPNNVHLGSAGVQQFTAVVVNNLDQTVTWAVDGVVGGNPTIGIIDGTGLYTAPAVVFGQGQAHTITATSVAFPGSKGVSGVYVGT